MERVGVLIEKLQEQLLQKADVQMMLVTAQLLHNELLMQARQLNGDEKQKISVVVPHAVMITPAVVPNDASHSSYKPVTKPDPEPEPVPAPTPETESPLDEPAPLPTPKPEPEPIPHFVEQKPWQSVYHAQEAKTRSWAIDPVLEVPTLAHQEKVM